MKKLFLILFIMLSANSVLLFSQVIFSNGTGGGEWTAPGTWLGGSVPGTNNDVVIAGTDSVWASSGVSCNNLTVLSDGKFVTGIDSIRVVGTLELEANAFFYNRASTPTLPGSERILDVESYVIHSGSGTIGGPENFEFGNLVIQRDQGVTAAADLTINGNLIVNMSGTNVFRGANQSLGESRTHTVNGDVYIYGGILSCVDVGNSSMYCIWNIKGDVYVIDNAAPYLESRISPFTSSNAAGLGIFNIDGDLLIDGGRLQGGNSSSAGTGTGIFNLGGNFTLTNTGAFGSSTHAGPFAINFVGDGTQAVTLRRNMSLQYPLSDTIKIGSAVVFDLADSNWRSIAPTGNFLVNGSLEIMGNSKISGGGSFILNSGGTLKIGSPDGISASGEIGNIQVSGTRTFNADANYEYKGTGAQSLGDALPNSLNGLAINNPDGIVLDRNLTINNSLNIISGDLDLNSNTITLGENASLTETAGNTVKGVSGKIAITKNIGVPASLNIGGLGASLTAGADLSSTLVERYHSPRSGFNNSGIARYYNISPGQNNTGLNAVIRIHYDESELNGITEANLVIAKSPDGSDNSWIKIGGVVNASENYVEAAGITDFSYWTLTDVTNPITDVKESSDNFPKEFILHQNYPNPFNPETKIKFEIPEASFVNISVYNLLGEKVAVLINEELEMGFYQKNFNALNLSHGSQTLPSGIYIYKLSAGTTSLSNKMILMK